MLKIHIGSGTLLGKRISKVSIFAVMAFFVPLALGLGYAAHQFLFPASSTSATTASGAEAKLTIKDFIKLAVDTNNLVLVDSSGNTIISPSSTGTMITGNVNVAVTTNTAQGYSLSVYTEDNSTSMVHSNSTVTDEISSIDTVSGYNAETGIAELSANTWGFRNRTTSGLSNWFAVGENESNGTVIANTNTGNSLYCEALSYPLENTGCDVGSYDTHSVNFGAKVTDAIAAGTYTNNVVFSAVAKSEGTRYTLKFNPNGGDNTMGPRTVVKGSTLTLPTKGFIKEGYVIKGWALTQADAEAKTENPSATTTNPTYSAGQTLEVTNLLLAATSAGQAVEQNALINLYAIWEEDVSYFQTTDICSTLPTGATSTLRDSRDNQDYTVYRWGSNAPAGMSNYCLMTKDLSLGYVTGGSVTKDADLTLTTDTSAAAGTISARTGTSDWSTDNSDDNLQYINGPQSGQEAYSSHSYYSYGAAQKVCPKGWRLPTKAEYDNIATFMGGNNSTGSSTIRSAPYNFVYGGNFNSGGWSNVGSRGDYWSSTQYGSTAGYNLYFNSSYLYTTSNGKNSGRSVRCIAEPTMQSFDASTSLLNIGDMATLTDARDGEKYVVKRLPDGKVWMVQNLRLINKTLTSEDSNVSSSFTVPTSTDPTQTAWCTSSSEACDDQPLIYYDASTRSSYGAIYNWYTATAGTGTYSTSSGTVSSSICPKGWRLPTGGAGGEFAALDIAWGGTGSGRSDANTYSTFTGAYTEGNNGDFDLAGYINGSSLRLVGTYGFWWSSTAYTSNSAYGLNLYSDNTYVRPQYYNYKYYGFPVRCVSS